MKINITEKVNNKFTFSTNYGDLKDRQKYHKKKQKGMSPFMNRDAGNVEKGIEAFNNASSSSSAQGGESTGAGE